MEVDNPRVPCRRSEDHDVRIEALGEVVQISPRRAGSPRSVKIAVRKNPSLELASKQFLYFKRFLEAWRRPEVWALAKACGSRLVMMKNSRRKVRAPFGRVRMRACALID